MTAADTTALLEKLDKPVRDLKWEPAIHGGWVALGAAGNYHICKDRRNGEVVYEVSNPFNHDNPRFPTADEAQAAAQADYERRILAALSLTPSDLEAIKAALVERDELRAAIPNVRETLIAINRRGGLGFGVHDNLEACIAALGKDKS